MNKPIHVLLVAFILSFALTSWGKDIPAKSNHLVNDYAHILSAQENNALERKLIAYYDSTSTQVAVVIERSLDGDDLFDYCQRLADGWGIGVKGKNNGVLIYVAVDDRKTRIHTGYGMEATITDALSTRIRTTQMNPAFKAGNFYEGLDEATTSIMQAASGEYTNDGNDKPMQKGPSMAVIFIVIIIIIVLISRGGGGGRGNRYRGGFGGPVFWGGTFGSGGFSGGGNSDGGFGGFGGGGFGGGGSGGSW